MPAEIATPEARAVTASDIQADLMASFRAGRYRPGQQLPNERQLAERYGASRQQVRDALLILQEAGLVTRRVGSGTWLAEDAPAIIERIDAQVDLHAAHELSFHETIEARLVMEPGVAALAARNIGAEGVARMRAAHAAVREAGSWIEFKSRIYLFARSYYEAAGNSFLLWTFDRIIKARADHKYDGGRETGPVAEIVRDHTHAGLAVICEAIAARDEARAEAVTRSYLIGIAASLGQG
jgi:DNA-binding FadR family transcriptional regulator